MKGSFIFLLLLTVFTDTTKGMQCDTGEEVAAECNCTFDTEMCCWRDRSNGNFRWNRESYSPHFMSANGDNSIKNGVARLESSEICVSVNVQYSLKFKYQIQSSGNTACQLAVYSKVDGIPLWRTNTSTTGWPHSPVINFTSLQKTKVRFDVIKSTNLSVWCRVIIDDIVIGHENITPSSTPLSPTTSLTPATTAVSSLSSSPSQSSSSSSLSSSSSSSSSTPQTTASPSPTPTMTSALTTDAADQTGDKDGVPAGAIIGIVIALIVLVIVCVVVILLVKRRGEGQEGLASLIFKKFGKPQNKRIVPPDENSTQTGGLQPGISHYENADIPESSNYYRMPVDGDRTSAGSHVVVYANEASGTGVFTVEPGSPYYINVSDRDPSRDYWTSLQPPEQDKNLYLSLGADAGHGGRLEGNTSSTYLTPVPDGGKCTEDAPVGRTGFYANSSAKDTYVNTKAN